MLRPVCLIALCFLYLPVFAKSELDIGDVPPSFLGSDTQGNRVELTELKGKIVVISFWASWCPPCLKELPVLEAIQQQAGTDHLQVVAINYKEDRRTYKKIKSKLDDLELTLTHDKRGSIGKKFGVEGIPHLFIVDRQGALAFQKRGYGEGSLPVIVDAINQQFATE